MIANTGGDRMFDWGGEFNTYLVPFSPFGNPTVVRSPNPQIQQFLLDLGRESGADRSLTEPDGELGLFTHSDPQWQANHGGPRDPQPGNTSGSKRDTQGGPEDDRNTFLPLNGVGGGGGGSGSGSGNGSNVILDAVYVAANPSDPTALALFVGGTNGNDTIVLQAGSTAGTVQVVINSVNRGQFALTGISRYLIWGNDGDDTITVSTSLPAIEAVIYGGEGNDTLTGGAGSTLIDGGAGNDRLTGQGARNVLIGGFGSDILNSGSGDDILIGGIWLFSEDLDAVAAMKAVWTSSATYDQRVSSLRTGGPDGLYAINDTTVSDDGVADTLNGTQGQDWFWAYLLDTDDKKGNEDNL
jgi:hypothetical protein